MTKKLIAILIVILLLAGGAWLWWGRASSPAGTSGEPLSGASPFGTPEGGVANIPAAQPSFEGEVAPLVAPSTQDNGQADKLRLFKLESSPVAGFVALTRGTSTVVRYTERGTGHIFETKLPDVQKVRLTNETLPQIYEAYFRQDGGVVLYRTLDESDVVRNMALTLTPPRGTSTEALYTISMTALRGQIDSISSGPGDVLTYVLKDTQTITSSKFNGDGVKNLWSGAFTSWRTGRLGTGTFVFTKPSASLPGYAYSLASQSLTKLIGPLNGLVVTANPAGTYLIYSYSAGNTTRLSTRGVKAGVPADLSPATLADKCVGSAQGVAIFFCGAPTRGLTGREPDQWYQGKTHFSDEIWRFDAISQGATLIAELEGEFGVTLDVSSPALSSDERYFIFINKNDLSLWALSLR